MINRVLLYNSGGGIGDAIQMLPLFNTLKNELKNTKLKTIILGFDMPKDKYTDDFFAKLDKLLKCLQ